MAMRVLRAILRLDYQRNFKMINEPGTVAKLLSESASANFFDFSGEDRAARRILVKRLYADEARFHALTVEPTTIVCDIERGEGVAAEALAEDVEFVQLCSVVSAITKAFAVTNFERAGLRVWMFGTNGRSVGSVLKACRELVAPNARNAFESVLGASADIGIAADGVSEAKVSYRMKFGPFIGSEEYSKYFSNISDLLPKEAVADTVIDLDLFETKFAYAAANIVKWCVPHLNSASALGKCVSEVIAKEVAK